MNINTMVVICLITFAIGASLFSQDLIFDLNSDGVSDKIIASRNNGEINFIPLNVDTLEIIAGDSNARLVLFYGDELDCFSGVTIFEDISRDGMPDLLVPRPDHEQVIYIESRWNKPICNEVIFIEYGEVINSPHDDVFDFGFQVEHFFDIDADGVEDFQVGAHYFGQDGEMRTRMYLYSGLHKILRGWANPDEPCDRYPLFLGDTNSNAKVDVQDFNIALQHLGESPTVRSRGDVNNNGIVDVFDIVEILENLEEMAFLPMEDIRVCSSDSDYRSYIGDIGWSCVKLLPYGNFRIYPIMDDEGLNTGMEIVLDEYPTPILHVLNNSCKGEVENCFSNNEAVNNAWARVIESCPLSSIGAGIQVQCNSCSSLTCPGGAVIADCDNDGSRTIEIFIFPNMVMGFCGILAHELIHVSQFCQEGFFDENSLCEELVDRMLEPHNLLCMEYQAYKDGGGVNEIGICNSVCGSVRKLSYWSDCQWALCELCVENGNCCDGYTWVCNGCLNQ